MLPPGVSIGLNPHLPDEAAILNALSAIPI
jgi:hypothetical protein